MSPPETPSETPPETPFDPPSVAASPARDLAPRAPRTLLTIDDWEKAARARLSPMAWDYYRSGADQERTLRRNRSAFARWTIWPRVLVDVAARDLATTVLGTCVPFPILIAPTAYHCLAHPDGELATARAAAELGALYVVLTLATRSLEDVRAAAPRPAPCWFQLYVHRDRGFTRELVARAVAAGHGAIVLTVDTPVLGRRLRDERNGFCLPPPLCMANLVGTEPGAELRGSALASYIASRHDASLTWRDVEWLRGLSPLPVVLKGVLRPDDARRAVDAGAAAVIVSNHGARQLDGAPSTIEALPGVVDAVAGRAEVLVDGGVRWGTDVLKAVGLGARAVLVGRPVLWGLAVDGQAGVRRVLEVLRDELSQAMALAGCPTLGAIAGTIVRTDAPGPSGP